MRGGGGRKHNFFTAYCFETYVDAYFAYFAVFEIMSIRENTRLIAGDSLAVESWLGKCIRLLYKHGFRTDY